MCCASNVVCVLHDGQLLWRLELQIRKPMSRSPQQASVASIEHASVRRETQRKVRPHKSMLECAVQHTTRHSVTTSNSESRSSSKSLIPSNEASCRAGTPCTASGNTFSAVHMFLQAIARLAFATSAQKRKRLSSHRHMIGSLTCVFRPLSVFTPDSRCSAVGPRSARTAAISSTKKTCCAAGKEADPAA